MGTTNFAFSHRCVVVTNDDLESGNVPEHSTPVNRSRDYPAYELDDYEGALNFFAITLTGGYYEGACIDYTDKDVTATQLIYGDYPLGWDDRRLARDIADGFGSVSVAELRRIIAETRESFPEPASEWAYWDLFDAIDGRVTALLRSREEKRANEILDEIRDVYGYGEAEVSGRFSDGVPVLRVIRRCA